MNKKKRKDAALFKVTKRLAFERADGMCENCKYHKADDVHHIVFRSHGGTSELSNLICLCRACHHDAHSVMARQMRERFKKIREKDNGAI